MPDPALGPDQEVYLGQTVSLEANGGVNYLWTPSTYLNETEQNIVSSTPSDDITYTVLVTDEYGCQNTEDINIMVYIGVKLAIPKAFTPNGDGVNDVVYFYARGMLKTNLKIFNRWGQLIFESDDQSHGWDGRFNGIDLEMDTYTYLLTGKTYFKQDIRQKGNLSLIR